MKKLIFLCLIVLTIISSMSCEKEPDEIIEPKLIFSSDTLYFNEKESQVLYVSVKPADTIPFQVISYPDWIQIDRISGIASKNLTSINITSLLDLKSPGIYSGSLVFMSSLGKDTIHLKGFNGEHIAYSINDSLKFSIFENSKYFTITNQGNVAVSFSAKTSNSYISIPNTTGEIAVGKQLNLPVNVNRSTIITGNYKSEIYITINDKTDTVKVSIANFKEQKMILNSNVADAEYSRKKDILVYVSSDNVKLNIYSVTTGVTESVALDYIPNCVSLSSDGEFALVGHDGHISYVDLTNKSVLKTLSVSCNALDVVLGNNKWAYVFPKADQWTNIRCVNINLSTDNETLNTGYSIYAGTKARLHPSGKYIYGADNGLSPSDLEKYDIQNGTAALLYDSPYHGDYPVSGDLWFSEDGLRVFTKGKTVFRTSVIKEQDMLYNGTITLESSSTYSYNRIAWLDHSAAQNNLYLLSTGESWNSINNPYVYVYNASNLIFKTKYALEKYLVSNDQGVGAFYEAEPYFVFCNSQGNKLFVLTKAYGSGLVNEWAIQKIDVQ